jgi:hypothetical protein
MAIILGLDVSTSCTGVCVIDSDVLPDEKGSHILVLEAIEFGGMKGPSGQKIPACITLWDKADQVARALQSLQDQLFCRGPVLGEPPVEGWISGQEHVTRVVLEEPLMGFRPGMSSAQTISQLMRFNGIVSYIARNIFKREPEYIGSAHARKLCGIKLQRTALGGPQKEQVFAHMAVNDLKHVAWPLKKSGKMVDWSRDACDAYVIARAASVNGPIQPPAKKAKKSKKAAEE